MNILFVHDHHFKISNEGFYSSGGLPATVWSRYLGIFDTVTVVGRNGGRLASGDQGYTLSSTEGASFELLPSISDSTSLFFGNKLALQLCRDLVARHDGIIARLPSRLGHMFVEEAVKQGKPYAVEVVACAWDALWNYGNVKGKLFAPLAALELKRTVAKSPFVLYVTSDFLQARYPCKNGYTISCSNVEVPPVPRIVLENRLRKIKCSQGKLIFGLIGNYSSKYKGIDVAIRALALASGELPSWELQVLGSGDHSYYSNLASELGVADKVNFVGSLPSGKAVYGWLDNIDIYLQPSFQEGLPRALVEAMSRGCPALASSIAGIPELLNPAQMISAGDYKALSKKLNLLVSDDVRRLEISRQNFEKAADYYKPVLDERRTAFWTSFRCFIEEKECFN